ncbi:hypothetical protein BKA93DRAFT_805987 [Sparassis latifolia]
MCYHIVTYVEYGCSHQVRTRRQYVDCNGANCRVSRFHMPVEHDCANECADIMLPDQHLVMTVRREQCNRCRGIEPSTTNGSNGSNVLNGHGESESGDETDN